jgi:hypothetical protein
VKPDSVALDLRLTDGTTDELIWAESFGASLGDVLGLYANATRAIAGRIGIELRPEVDAALASAPQVSPEAYEALLQARFHRIQLSEEGLSTALDYLERAIEKRDPNIPYLSVEPIFDYLRDEPRFQALMRRLGLPE